jgi:hypothetical protein
MSTRIVLAAIAAVALTAARPAAAQRAASAAAAHADLYRTAAAPRAASRVLASYRLAGTRDVALPSQVVVADSAGMLVASYRAPGRPAQPMSVTVMGTDLVLQGQTASGLLTLVLARQNDADSSARLAGHWSLDDRRGSLRGQARR